MRDGAWPLITRVANRIASKKERDSLLLQRVRGNMGVFIRCECSILCLSNTVCKAHGFGLLTIWGTELVVVSTSMGNTRSS